MVFGVDRSLVSFAAPLADAEPPPGRALAALLAARVERARGIGLRGDYTWVVRHGDGEFHVSWLDDRPPLQWLVTCAPGAPDRVRTLTTVLHAVLDAEPGITDVRWYTAEDWLAGGVVWRPRPDER